MNTSRENVHSENKIQKIKKFKNANQKTLHWLAKVIKYRVMKRVIFLHVAAIFPDLAVSIYKEDETNGKKNENHGW